MVEFWATVVPALGHALLHFVWQGALIGLLAALALHCLRHAQPQARYIVACLALLACVLVPLVSVSAQIMATSFAPIPAGTPAHLPGINASPHTSDALFGFVLPAASLDAFLPWVVDLWAAGTCVMSLRMALGLVWIRRLRRAPQGEAQATWQIRLDVLAKHFDLRRSVALRLVDTLDSPVSAGWWHPVVVLPTALLTRMPVDSIEALLAHELAHIRRHDYLINLLQNAVEALLFYHPVTWWLSRRIRIEREQIADQLAAEVACGPRRLACALAELSELHRTGPSLHLTQAARGGLLMSRIEQLVRPGPRAGGSKIALPLLAIAAACFAFYAHAQMAQARAAVLPFVVDPISIAHDTDSPPAHADFGAVEALSDQFQVLGNQRMQSTQALGDQRMRLLQTIGNHRMRLLRILGEQRMRLEQVDWSEPRRAKVEADVRKLDAQHDALVQWMDAQHDALMQRIDTKQDALTQRIDAKQDALTRQMVLQMDALTQRPGEQPGIDSRRIDQSSEGLSRQMQAAGEPIEALGAQLDALAKQQDTLVIEVDRRVNSLIDDAVNLGLALAVPSTVRTR